MIFYTLAIHLFALISLPKVLLNRSKYKGTLLPRLGIGFPKIEKGEHELIWFHAVSLGETKAILPLIAKFKAQSVPPLILLTTTTKTGQAEAQKSGADYTSYLPLDLPYIIKPLVKRLDPDLVILSETDFWAHFQNAAKKVVLVNGKLSTRSASGLKRLPMLLSGIDHFCVQSATHKKRFEPLTTKPLTITGNLKLDSRPPAPTLTRSTLGLTAQDFVITLGSTHNPEEKIWLKALTQLWKKHSHIKVLLAPRHPERFNEVAGFHPCNRWSTNRNFDSTNLLLVDTMGELLNCYAISDLAFVGGSFTPAVGGHNILEPAYTGTPTLFGPHMHSQPDLLALTKSYNSALQITPQQIVSTVERFIKSPAERMELAVNGKKLLEDSRGAVDKTFSVLQEMLAL